MPSATCDKCSETTDINCSEVEWNAEHHEERKMGSEIVHTGIWERICHKCNAELKVEFTVYEYPEGSINLREIDPEGCECDGECSPIE